MQSQPWFISRASVHFWRTGRWYHDHREYEIKRKKEFKRLLRVQRVAIISFSVCLSRAPKSKTGVLPLERESFMMPLYMCSPRYRWTIKLTRTKKKTKKQKKTNCTENSIRRRRGPACIIQTGRFVLQRGVSSSPTFVCFFSHHSRQRPRLGTRFNSFLLHEYMYWVARMPTQAPSRPRRWNFTPLWSDDHAVIIIKI